MWIPGRGEVSSCFEIYFVVRTSWSLQHISPSREPNMRLQQQASLRGTAYPFLSFTELSGNQLGKVCQKKLPCLTWPVTLWNWLSAASQMWWPWSSLVSEAQACCMLESSREGQEPLAYREPNRGSEWKALLSKLKIMRPYPLKCYTCKGGGCLTLCQGFGILTPLLLFYRESLGSPGKPMDQ